MNKERSVFWWMFSGSSGFVKLGHPVPDSNLSSELNSGSPEPSRHLHLRVFRQPALARAAIEHGRLVLGPVIAELSVGRQRIDVVPECVEQLLVGHPPRIVDDLHRLEMPGFAG